MLDFEMPKNYRKLIPYAVCLGAAAIIIAVIGGGSETTAPQTEVGPQQPDPQRGLSSDEIAGLESSAEGSPEEALVAYQQYLSGQLEAILSRVRGSGGVHVAVMLEFGPTFTYHDDVDTTESETEEEDAEGGTRSAKEQQQSSILAVLRKASGDEKPVLRRIDAGEVRGILVVAEGAGDLRIKAQLRDAVSTLMNIPAYKVTVLPAEGGD